MIQNISIKMLHHHPDNPRKDLGDLTELSESIKINGVLQNLTIVPWFSTTTGVGADDPKQQEELGFYVVIGNRRLAAAKIAGLEELPCALSNMNHREQIGTMLLENMQRSDLSIYEQAQGIQMMLDMGDTVSGISEKTGFSETTVRRRVKLMELDKSKLQESVLRGGTLQDYVELDKIKDIKRKNKVLDKIGTPNFNWELNQAIEEEARPERKKALIAEIDKWAKSVLEKECHGLTYVNGFYNFKMDNFKKPKDAGTAEYFYTVTDAAVTLYKKEPKADKKPKSAAEKAYDKRDAQLKEVTKRAFELRNDFVKNSSTGKKHGKYILELAVNGLMSYGRAELEDVLKLLCIDKLTFDEKTPNDEKDKKYNALIAEQFAANPERVLLIAAYCRFGDSQTNRYYHARSWELKHNYESNTQLDKIYDVLIALGYEMSDEERALRDGTHELLTQRDVTE